jgi:Uma2 family endonuclease
MLVKEKEITVEEFEQFLRLPEYQGRLFELINGKIVEKMPTEEHGTIVLNIGSAIKYYIRQQGRGRVGAEIRYRLLSDRHNSRQPDLSYSHGTLPAVISGAVPHMPELVVEVQSPDDSVKAMRERAEYFIANDVQLVWLVFPRKRYVEVYSPDHEMEILFGSDSLSGGDLLPGFAMSIEEVFADL